MQRPESSEITGKSTYLEKKFAFNFAFLMNVFPVSFGLGITMTTNSTVSFEKPPGTNDLDAKFSPTEAEIIIENTPNDGLSQSNIYKLTLGQVNGRELIEEDAKMPDWK